MKYIGICFGDEKYKDARDDYVAQLLSKNIFDKVIAYGPGDFDSNFFDQHKIFIKSNPNGYGLWIWKPYFILKTLLTMNDGDILVYGDASNKLHGAPQECLSLFNKVNEIRKGVKIIASKQGWNIRWIKSDLYLTMGWRTLRFAFTFMAEAARIVIKKDNQSLAFAKEWVHYATTDYHNIDDSPSRLPNLPFFIAHRNDQSIFSILFHKYNGTRVEFDEIWRVKDSHYK